MMKAVILGKEKRRVIVSSPASARRLIARGWQIVAFIREQVVYPMEAA